MDDNITIAKNTVILTIKLVITIICGFVVSRLVLHALGADNYGLYNVVGGIVALLNIVATSMVATSYRYMAVEIGKGKSGDPRKVHSTLLLIHCTMAVLLVLIGLPIGSFYINHFLNVTSATIGDAQFVYFFSLLACFFSVIVVPDNGLLVANENFLLISIIEVLRSILNVAIATVLLYYVGNRLRVYALLMSFLNVAYSISVFVYCKYKYPDVVQFKINKDIKDYKEITSFTGWMLLGASAVVGRTQGVAMVINLFFRNSINAAFGIANQIGNATSMFTSTLRQAVNPQIMKNQEVNAARSLNLVYAISRYTFLIMLVISVPLLLCMDTILALWLGTDNVPSMTAVFSSFLLLNGLIEGLRAGFDASIQATGDVRKNQIGYTIINISIIPIVYMLYKMGFPAYINVAVGVVLTVITLFFQAYIMRELTSFNYRDYWAKTLFPSFCSCLAAFLPMLGVRLLISNHVVAVLCFAVGSFIWTSLIVFFLGITKGERDECMAMVSRKLKISLRNNS